MLTCKRIWLVVGLLRLCILSPSVRAADADASRPEAICARVLRSTAFVESPDGSGTAWVADRQRGLLVTNYHVVAKESGTGFCDSVIVVFPAYRNGREIAEKSYYEQHIAELKRSGRAVEARVLDALERCDLALLQVQKLPDDILALPLAAESPRSGSRLHAVGNPGDNALWMYSGGAVKQVARQSWGSKMRGRLLRFDACVVVTQAPSNPGDSGGPVVNDATELVAVTQGGSQKSTLINTAIDVSEVRAYLAEVGWMARPRTAADYHRRAHHYFRDVYYGPRPDRNNRVTLALADLNQAILWEPNNPDYYLDRSRVYQQLGFSASFPASLLIATKESRVAPAEYTKALADCNKAIELRGQYALAYARRASVRLALAPFGRNVYLDVLDRATRGRNTASRPWLAPGADRPAAKPLTGPGLLAFETETDRALADCRRALELDRDCIAAYQLLATHYCYSDNAKALEYHGELIRRQPANAGALEARSNVYKAQKNYVAARQDLDKAIGLEPQEPRFYASRGFLAMEQNRFDQAVMDRLKVVTLRPEDPWNWRRLAESLAAMGKSDEAIGAYTEALKFIELLDLQFAGPADILVARGDLFFAKGDTDRARADYRAALRVQTPTAEFAKKVQEKLGRILR